ncbi:MAG: bacillithiol transferase BstA [Thermoanaerobaculia bacterium]|nr:bacillithiol transferase BstA [Thermoanaerobaculia bacterium]
MTDDRELETLRYPIGRFDAAVPIEIETGLSVLEDCPSNLRAAVEGLRPAQLDTPYRPGGWTVRQVVHHVPDSHLNSYVRFRWALTEDSPRIKTYREERWAELPDSTAPPEVSLDLLEMLHKRWLILLRELSDDDWQRTWSYPDGEGPEVFSLQQALALYAWHSRHHVAHVTRLRERMGW